MQPKSTQNTTNHHSSKHLPKGKYADGIGLWLVKSHPDSGKWVQRLTVNSHRREMGLGRYPDIFIAEVRKKGADARKQLLEGVDPITERAKNRRTSEHRTLSKTRSVTTLINVETLH